MSPLSSFAQHAVDLFAGVGQVKARSMFGGYGLSLEGISIGLISDDRIYLRTDEVTRAEFQRAGSGPFIYHSKNGPMTMKSYWALPEDSVDDPERAARWGRLAADAGQRAEAAKAPKKAPQKKPAPSSSKARAKVKVAASSKPKPKAKAKTKAPAARRRAKR